MTKRSYTFTYDKDNRVTKVTNSNSKTVSYTYNSLGNRTKLTYPDNSYLTYTYDTANRLSTIVDGTTKTYTFTYDSLNRRTKLTYPSAANNTYAYDEISRLTGITNRLGTYTYQYDKTINRTALTEPQGTHSYTYDPIYQLKTAAHNTQPSESYTYDLTGNRTGSTTNSANQIISDATYTYSYDNNGNMKKRTTKATGAVRTFTWDYENRLTRVVETGLDAQYKYDPFGRRIEKNANGVVTKYVYDGMSIVAEYNSSGTLVTRYTQGPGIDEHLSMQKSGNVYYYHTDGLGSVTSMTDSAGTVVQTYAYDSFGHIVHQTGSIQQPYTYTGREYDSETGLYYYRARYYDTMTGKFISKDPIGFAGGDMNLYRYVGNNPVNWIDPYGLFTYGDGAGGPVNTRTANALTCFENCVGSPVVVTGGQECGPPHVPGSAHCSGEACDLGRNNNPQLNSNNVARCFNQCSGANGFVWGYAGGPNFHMQTRPGAGGATGFRR